MRTRIHTELSTSDFIYDASKDLFLYDFVLTEINTPQFQPKSIKNNIRIMPFLVFDTELYIGCDYEGNDIHFYADSNRIDLIWEFYKINTLNNLEELQVNVN